MSLRDRVAKLEARRKAVLEMGGPEKIARQHARGKLTVRERMTLLFDDGDYFEVGAFGRPMGTSSTEDVPADAVVCAFGKVDGRMVCAAAYDFTVKGGSIGPTGEVKVTRLRQMALSGRWPIVWLIDSAGARIDPSGQHPDVISTFAATGHLFREQVLMSGVVPQVAAMVGPGAAGTAYIPGLADFVPMVRGVGSLALGGPPLVKAVTGEEVDEQSLGGSTVHCEVSGVADAEAEDDAACIHLVKRYLSFLPSNCDAAPPRRAAEDPVDRREEALLDIVPDDTRAGYDMLRVLKLVVDDADLFELKARFGRSVITALARIGGSPVGIIASQPLCLGGVLENDSADKAAKFIQICDAYNLPLIFFQDTPGFLIGSKVEQAGIIRHGAKMLHAMSAATVPKITVVVRKAYGAGYYAMCGRAYEPDLIVAWPGAEISVMGAEGMVGIAAKKLFGGAEPDAATRSAIVDHIQQHIDIHRVAGWGFVDDVIDPRDTRLSLAWGLELSRNKRLERPEKKRSILPV